MVGSSPEWDHPFFKALARNDTGQGRGKQSGFVVPVTIRQYFPKILGEPCMERPAIAVPLIAHLYVMGERVGEVRTRYQVQSWGTSRREHRVTSALRPLLAPASAGDILVLQRKTDSSDVYSFNLLLQGSAEYEQAMQLTGTRRWGPLDPSMIPESFDKELAIASLDQAARELAPFRMFDESPEFNVSIVSKIARSLAFRKSVLTQYGNCCAVCGFGLRTPAGTYEVEAAHGVPRSEGGADDVRNGLALCRKHHWAFDSGLFGISDDLRLFVPSTVTDMPENNSLAAICGNEILQASDHALRVDPAAFKWHLEKTVYKDGKFL